MWYETGKVYPVVSIFADGKLLILELKEFYTRFTNDVIATTAFGLKVDSLKQPTNEFYMMGQGATNFGAMRLFMFLAIPKVVKVRTVFLEANYSYVYVYLLKR
jgi:cytochrome P450 family 9